MFSLFSSCFLAFPEALLEFSDLTVFDEVFNEAFEVVLDEIETGVEPMGS